MQDKELQVKTMSRMLEEGLNEVFSTEYFRRFLSFIANNPNYTYRNVILILQQCPHATKTRGYKSWINEGRIVQREEKGLRINACFERAKQEDNFLLQAHSDKMRERRKNANADSSKFYKISVFDISQTRELGAGEDNDRYIPHIEPAGNIFDITRLEGAVTEYDELLQDIQNVSPLPVLFSSGARSDGNNAYDSIIINKDMSQLHIIRTIINQIVRVWLHSSATDREQFEIVTESITFIVCSYLNLDTSEFSFRHIAKYSLGREQNALKQFLDTIQTTALYFIDTLDGVRTMRNIRYVSEELFLLVNKKTVLRFFKQGYYIYLFYPDRGELLAMNKKDIEQYEGPFAVLREDWFGYRQAAA